MIATVEDTFEFQTKSNNHNYNRSTFLLIRADSLKEEYRSFQNQLRINQGGFGCDPTALGTAVFLKDPVTDEVERFQRSDILGTPSDECIAAYLSLYDPVGQIDRKFRELPIPNFNSKEK